VAWNIRNYRYVGDVSPGSEKKKSFARRCLEEKRRPAVESNKATENQSSPVDPMPEWSGTEGEMENQRCHRCLHGKNGVFCWEVTEKRRWH
jgi:hypothetical protein